MAKDRIEVEILAKGVKEAQASIGKLTKQFDSLKKTGDKTSSILSSSFLKIGIAVAGLGVAMKKGLNLARDFLKFEQGVDAMERQFGVSSKAIIKQLNAVAQGTIATADIVSAANRAMALNVTKDVDQMAQLLAIAGERAKTMGLDTTTAFNDIVTGIGRACLVPDTLVTMADDSQKKIIDVQIGDLVKTINDMGEWESAPVARNLMNGHYEVFKLTSESGHNVTATENHKFLTDKGWKLLGDIDVKKDLVRIETKMLSRVVSITKAGKSDVYDITVPKNENFLANGIVNHNSPLILDNLGIITKGWDVEAKAAGVAMDAQFILNKVLADGAVLLDKEGASALTNAQKLQQAEASMKNLGLAVGRTASRFLLKFTPAISAVADALINLFDDSDPLEKITLDLAEAEERYADALKISEGLLDDVSKKEKGLADQRVVSIRSEVLRLVAELNKEFEKQNKTEQASQFLGKKSRKSLLERIEATKEMVETARRARDAALEDFTVRGRVVARAKEAVDVINALEEANGRVAGSTTRGIKLTNEHKIALEEQAESARQLGVAETQLSFRQDKVSQATEFSTASSKRRKKIALETAVALISINQANASLFIGNAELASSVQVLLDSDTKRIALTKELADEQEKGGDAAVVAGDKAVVMTASQIKALERLKAKAIEMGVAESVLAQTTIAGVREMIKAFQELKALKELIIQGTFDSAQAVSDALFGIGQQNRDAELAGANEFNAQIAALDEQEKQAKIKKLNDELAIALANGDTELANEKKNALLRIDLDEKQAAKEKKLKKKGFEDNKKTAIAQAIINTALAIGNALATVIPFVPNALIAAGLAFTKGGAEVAVIANQKPPLAQGTSFAPAGSTLVGEEGPEVVNMPQGAEVIPNSQINNESIDNRNITINVSSPDAIEFVNDLKQTHGLEVFS